MWATRPLSSRIPWSGGRVVRDVLGHGKQAPPALTSEVTVQGWVRTTRVQKSNIFVEVGDGSSVKGLQVVLDATAPNVAPIAKRLSVGASVQVTGRLEPSPHAGQAVELQGKEVAVLGDCDGDSYPLQKKGHSMEFLRDVMHLRPRSNVHGAMCRVRHTLCKGIRDYFDAHSFVELHTPIITSNDCEGAGDLFKVTAPSFPGGDFFGTPAYLTVSGQLHAEAFAAGLGRVFTFGPTFRAENSNTARHLAEFWMVEPEVSFANHHDVIDIAEGCVKHAVKQVLDTRQEEVAFFTQRVDKTLAPRLEALVSKPWPRITFHEAVDLLNRNLPSAVDTSEGLATEHEKLLCTLLNGPVAVTDYPAAVKPFYMRQNGDAANTVACFDLLVPRLGELIGGSAREERLDLLQAALKARGLTSPDLEWYIDLRRFGTVPHAGWGLGLERLVLLTTGLENIRDAIPVPRAPGSCRM